jgi:hypothetical protein
MRDEAFVKVSDGLQRSGLQDKDKNCREFPEFEGNLWHPEFWKGKAVWNLAMPAGFADHERQLLVSRTIRNLRNPACSGAYCDPLLVVIKSSSFLMSR